VTYKAGNFGDDMMARDIVNYGGLWANEISEAIYFVGLTDNEKHPLTGDATYEIRYPADALPGTMAAGGPENLQRLNDRRSGVSVALAQGGLTLGRLA
jgi:hypothetical protein